MNEKGFTLDLFGAEISGPSISRNNLTPFLIVAAILLVVAAIVILPLPASSGVATSPAVGSVDAARWQAMGEQYQAMAAASEKAAEASVARWVGLGEQYSGASLSTERAIDADTARWIARGAQFMAFEGAIVDGWNKHADYYESNTSAAEQPLIDGWNRHADFYEAGNSTVERPLIDGWNRHADYYEPGLTSADGLDQAALASFSKLVEYHQSHGR